MDRKKAIALSFSVPVAWGFSYPLMKIGMDSMNATSIVALRCIIAFVACLLLFHKRAFRINRDLMVRAAIIGAIMATELTCMCLGSSLTSASTAGFLQSLTVVIVPFANAALLRRAPERKVLIGTAIVTCGMLLLSGADFTSLNPGAIIMLLSAFIYASHIIVAKRFVEEVDPLALGVWQLGFGGLFSGIAAFTFGGFTRVTRVGRTRQHAVFGSDPSLPLAFQKARHAFINRSGAQYFRVTKFDQHGAFCVFCVVTGQGYWTHLISATACWTHDVLRLETNVAAHYTDNARLFLS